MVGGAAPEKSLGKWFNDQMCGSLSGQIFTLKCEITELKETLGHLVNRDRDFGSASPPSLRTFLVTLGQDLAKAQEKLRAAEDMQRRIGG